MPTPLQDIAVVQNHGPFLGGWKGTTQWRITNLDYSYRRGQSVRVRVELKRAGNTYVHVATFPSEGLDEIIQWELDSGALRAMLERMGRQAGDEALDLLTLGRLPRTGSPGSPA